MEVRLHRMYAGVKTSWKILPPSWMQDADLRMQISI